MFVFFTLHIVRHPLVRRNVLKTFHSVSKTLWARYRLQFLPNHFRTSYVSCARTKIYRRNTCTGCKGRVENCRLAILTGSKTHSKCNYTHVSLRTTFAYYANKMYETIRNLKFTVILYIHIYSYINFLQNNCEFQVPYCCLHFYEHNMRRNYDFFLYYALQF